MTDSFQGHTVSLTAPPSSAISVTPSDTVDLPYVSRALHIGTGGDLRVLTRDGQDVTYRNLSGLKILRVARVFATGTTAADIIAEW